MIQEDDDQYFDNRNKNNDGFIGPIYSKYAIRGFSIFFSPVFGGVLLFQNLKDAGYVREAYQALLFSIFYTVVASVGVNLMTGSPFFSLFCNVAGAFILTEFFYKRFFPEADAYAYKPIWKPLIISLLIAAPFVAATMYAVNHGLIAVK